MSKSFYAIFVLDRGFVVIAHARLHGHLAFHWQAVGRTIRRWGTTEGVAQLKNGPRSETVLDAEVNRIIPFRSIIEIMEVDEAAWEQHVSRLPEE
jgi:hypothetical protein